MHVRDRDPTLVAPSSKHMGVAVLLLPLRVSEGPQPGSCSGRGCLELSGFSLRFPWSCNLAFPTHGGPGDMEWELVQIIIRAWCRRLQLHQAYELIRTMPAVKVTAKAWELFLLHAGSMGMCGWQRLPGEHCLRSNQRMHEILFRLQTSTRIVACMRMQSG
uniref:Uncharacterized protein n=1 Tax=Zea mays TaxID=4577 RepID=A0A804P600_MAIZE